jgi:arabinofuranosyltransferase
MPTGHETSARHLDGAKAAKVFALLVCAVVLLRHAWVSDDAFITLRTVRNLIEGEGPRWNLHERVQGFTHPLWMLALSLGYGLTGDPVGTVFVLSLGLSLLTLYWIAFRMRLSAPAAVLALAILISSKSFVDYSTSGLENPLTHFLFVLLVSLHLREPNASGDLVAQSRRKALLATLLAGLMALNRMDAFVVALPLLWSALAGMRDSLRGAGKTLLKGFLPFLAWEIFALIYYGFPFPNTAYAKLASDTPTLALWAQGTQYFLSQMAFDPCSLLAIAGALVMLALERRLLAVGAAIVFYLIYIVSIGGDFMAGRFFALPVLVSALALANSLPSLLARPGVRAYVPAILVVATALLLTPHPTLSREVDYALSINPISKDFWDERGVTDERAYYASSSSLFRTSRTNIVANDWRRSRGLALPANGAQTIAQIGVTGFYAPPTAIIIDGYGLCDAYIARLPAADKVTWRIGHFGREIPPGYLDTLKEGRNRIVNPKYAWAYERIKRVVSGPIWNWERWKEIARLNLNLEGPPMPPPPKAKPKRALPKVAPPKTEPLVPAIPTPLLPELVPPIPLALPAPAPTKAAAAPVAAPRAVPPPPAPAPTKR